MHHHSVAKHGQLSVSFTKAKRDTNLSPLMNDLVTTLKAALAASSDDELLSAASAFLRHVVYIDVQPSKIPGLEPLLVLDYQKGLTSRSSPNLR